MIPTFLIFVFFNYRLLFFVIKYFFLSDPLTNEFKNHIKYKLECYTRYRVENREINLGNNGTGGGGKRLININKKNKTKKNLSWKTMLGPRR